jgi:hypothetical protein
MQKNETKKRMNSDQNEIILYQPDNTILAHRSKIWERNCLPFQKWK